MMIAGVTFTAFDAVLFVLLEFAKLPGIVAPVIFVAVGIAFVIVLVRISARSFDVAEYWTRRGAVLIGGACLVGAAASFLAFLLGLTLYANLGGKL
jgi:hypothetical protein